MTTMSTHASPSSTTTSSTTFSLFVSPKRGGILQSSGFLDLRSLMALALTAKSNALDERSIIILMENEITRCHAFQTMEEALCLLRHVCTYNGDHHHHHGVDAHPSSSSSLSLSMLFPLKSWLHREPSTAVTVEEDRVVVVTRDMLQAAMRYEVMFHKMLRWHHHCHHRHHYASSTSTSTDTGTDTGTTVTCTTESNESNDEYTRLLLLGVVSEQDDNGWSLLHRVARAGNIDAIRAILDLYRTESERLEAVTVENILEQTVLHCAAKSGNVACINCILSLYPECERMQVVSTMVDRERMTVLHHVAHSGSMEALGAMLDHLCPKSKSKSHEQQQQQQQQQHVQAVVNMRDASGRTVLHHAAYSVNLQCIDTVLGIYPESELISVLNMQDRYGMTPVHYVVSESDDPESIRAILGRFSPLELLRVVHMRDHCCGTVLHIAALKGPQYINTILDLCPESERVQVLDMVDLYGDTVLHCAANAGLLDCIKALLAFYPQSERLRAVSAQDARGGTVLHCAASSGNIQCLETLLALYPDSQHQQQVLRMQNQRGKTVWNCMSEETRQSVMEWLSLSSD